MRLGSTLRRRRGRERGLGASLKLVVVGFVLLALGFGGGYVLTTRILFPTPAPPDGLAPIPDLRRLGLGEAVDRIGGAGLLLASTDSVSHPTLSAGRVVGQSPIPGQMAVPGDSVRLTVSLGPEERPVPDVYRVRSDRARAVLEATGFRVVVDSVESELPRGSVLSLDPEPGTEVTLPGEVGLIISLGPPQVPMPLLVGLTEDEALIRLDSLGLAVAEVARRYIPGVDRGIVLGQEPDVGDLLERGTAVRLVVAGWGVEVGNFPGPEPVEWAGIPGRSRRDPTHRQ